MTLRALFDLPAPAKLNLFLHVTGRRPDGYHLLQSVFVPIDWQDRLHLLLREDGELAREDLGETLPPEDLCLQAARALRQATGCRLGATIRIEKVLPSGAGLGGGSSDAATVLIGLNRLWQTGLDRTQLARIALSLGADVPFFIHGQPAWVEGVGERITPISLPPLGLAVVKPAASLPTAAIFTAPDLVRDSEVAILLGFPERDLAAPGTGTSGVPAQRVSLQDIADGFGRNDLQAVAERLEPQVVHALRQMSQAFGNSRMTGSGSAVFSRVSAHPGVAVAPQMPFDLPAGWVGRMCRSLEAHPLRDWVED